MGRVVLELDPPASVNAAPAKSSRGAGIGRHKAKKALEADLARLLLAAGVPRPIPGGRVRATARILTPKARRRDEGNFRAPLEKALGDALSPFDRESPFRWLDDDQPPAFTFGAVTFGQTEPGWDGKPKRGVCELAIVWGEDLYADLKRELLELGDALEAEHDANRRAGVAPVEDLAS